MALEDMLEALEKESEADIEKIRSQARANENQIMKEADLEASKILETQKRHIEDQIMMERSKIINTANFHVKKEVIKAKEEVLNNIFSKVSESSKNLRNSNDYEKVFEKLVYETLAGIRGKAIVSVDSNDEKMARKILDKMDVSYELKTDIKALGGLKVQSEDRKVVLNNTVDARVEKAKQLLKSDVVKILFGDN